MSKYIDADRPADMKEQYMKSVMLSIRPKWCEKIASGKKTLEVRKTRPKIPTPFKCYIYCTNAKDLMFWRNKKYSYCDDRSHNAFDQCMNGKVIGEFVCDNILRHCNMQNSDIAEQYSLVKREKLFEYSNGKELFGWHISDLIIYDKPKELSEFLKPCTFDECDKCDNCRELSKLFNCRITRPPQSWCYVEELI